MDVTTAILTRRSIHSLSGPAPSDQEFAYLLKGAAAAPDHGRLRPWRWILLRNADLEAVGARLAAEAEPEERDLVMKKFMRAPLKAVLVFSPKAKPRVPEWEQLASASNVAYGLMLLLHARGFGSIWRTGRLCQSPGSRSLLGVEPDEQLLGSLDIGTPAVPAEPVRRSLEDVTDRMHFLRR
ncbi:MULTISPECIES: nitroreductase family protein [unclassified Streptomyces]|uniref:nitroreductase family protein n=1 Tax=unclassified Streptomyces TaxID=2593676 RepID=UPI00056D4DAC|nr:MULTISPECIES: nitroreductase family protein [unclassified Streptomyces]